MTNDLWRVALAATANFQLSPSSPQASAGELSLAVAEAKEVPLAQDAALD